MSVLARYIELIDKFRCASGISLFIAVSTATLTTKKDFLNSNESHVSNESNVENPWNKSNTDFFQFAVISVSINNKGKYLSVIVNVVSFVNIFQCDFCVKKKKKKN